MQLFTKIVVFMTLLAVQSLAATIISHPAKVARWVVVPRTLQLDIVDEREIELPPIRRTDLLTRQTGCSPTDVACEGDRCCPSGFTCFSTGSIIGCCTIGETCFGLPIECADPNSFECPASIGGCCHNGQECYLDYQGVARCGNTTTETRTTPVPIYSSTFVTATPIYGTTTVTPRATATPMYSSRSSGVNPTSTPVGGGSVVGSGPRTTATVDGVRKGVKMGMELGVLLMPCMFAMLA